MLLYLTSFLFCLNHYFLLEGCQHDEDLIWSSTAPTGDLEQGQWKVCGFPGNCATQAVLADATDPNALGYVRCCSDSAISGWLKRDYCSIWSESDAWGSCSGELNYSQAVEFCASHGGRLCTRTELVEKCAYGHGCGYDVQNVWSSTPGWEEILSRRNLRGKKFISN